MFYTILSVEIFCLLIVLVTYAGISAFLKDGGGEKNNPEELTVNLVIKHSDDEPPAPEAPETHEGTDPE